MRKGHFETDLRTHSIAADVVYTPSPRCFLEVRIIKGLWGKMVEVLILQDLKSFVFSAIWMSS